MPRRVVIVLHQGQSTYGRVGHFRQARGIPLDIRRPRCGDPLPDTLAAHSGAVVFGGSMSVNDPDGYIRAEVEGIKGPLAEVPPLFVIWLCAQLLVGTLWADVAFSAEGNAE